MIDLNEIKLVIWDLDDTFWKGTLSEGTVEFIQENITLVKELTNIGIINTICSKNYSEPVKAELIKAGVYEYFVFSSINWEPKGERIKDLLHRMSLRAVNALFIDDNVQNLKEASYYNPELLISSPEIIPNLISFVKDKNKCDIKHKRLLQYKLLEKKSEESLKYKDNEDFLRSSNIQVSIHEDCLSQIDRIYELVKRTNQLNYTKKRESKEELIETIKKSTQSGYITVKDNFGDYGIIGFFAIINKSLVHFLFSCRTIGQGIEQYVYAKLGFPNISIVGDVYTLLDKHEIPDWINGVRHSSVDNYKEHKTLNILLKGPCDLMSVYGYMKNKKSVACEFTYVSLQGLSIESHNHSTGIKAMLYTKEQKQELVESCIFIDHSVFNSIFFSPDIDVIFLSTLPELNLGIYRKKGTELKIAFGEWTYPLTDKTNWARYINNEIFTANNNFSYEFLEAFSKDYEFVGRTSIDEYLSFLDLIMSKLSFKTHLFLILGVEREYMKNSKLAYMERHLDHQNFNREIKKYCAFHPRVHCLELNDIVCNQTDFVGNINHYTPRVYYILAQKINNILNELSHGKEYSIYKIHIITNYFNILKGYILSHINVNRPLGRSLRKIYHFIFKKSF